MSRIAACFAALKAQGKTALIVKQDRAAEHIALILFQNNTTLDAPPPLDKVSRSGGADVDSISAKQGQAIETHGLPQKRPRKALIQAGF